MRTNQWPTDKLINTVTPLYPSLTWCAGYKNAHKKHTEHENTIIILMQQQNTNNEIFLKNLNVHIIKRHLGLTKQYVLQETRTRK